MGNFDISAVFLPDTQAYQRLQIQQQMLQAQRNVSGPIRQQEQQVRLRSGQLSFLIFPADHSNLF